MANKTYDSGAALAGITPGFASTLPLQVGDNGDGTGTLQIGPNTTSQVTATAGTVVKATPGRLWSVMVTTVGTAAVNVYDNASAASGTILCAIPANAPVGSIYPVNFPAKNGIYVGGVASGPTITLGYT